jgi:hypothetical protein
MKGIGPGSCSAATDLTEEIFGDRQAYRGKISVSGGINKIMPRSAVKAVLPLVGVIA